MKQTLAILLGLYWVSHAFADETGQGTPGSDEGRAILMKAVEETARTKLVRYEADYKGTDWITEHVPEIQAKVIVGEQSKWKLDRFRSEVKIKAKDAEEVVELTGGSDGDEFFLIDPKTKMVHVDMDPIVMGAHSRNLQRVVLSDFAAAEPFEEALKAKEIELKGTADVAGVACDEIAVTSEDGQQRAIWYFAKADHLPRRVVRIYKNPEGKEGTTDLTLTNLVVNPRIADPFKPVVPSGFTKTDEFAP